MRAIVMVLLCSLGTLAACGDDTPEMPAGAREVTIDAPGGELNAVEMGDGPTGVVLVHGASTTKELWYPLMPALADADMRGLAGEFSGDRLPEIGAAIEYLASSGSSRIVLVGSSLGGANVLDFASEVPVGAVVTFSVGDGGGWTIDEPGLYIASEGDGSTADAARSLAERFDGEALVVDGDTHGADLMKPHPEVIDRVVEFIEESGARS